MNIAAKELPATPRLRPQAVGPRVQRRSVGAFSQMHRDGHDPSPAGSWRDLADIVPTDGTSWPGFSRVVGAPADRRPMFLCLGLPGCRG